MRAVAALMMGLFVSTAHAQLQRLTPDQQERFATLINMNGQLCAKVLEARKRDDGTYYVLCETHTTSLAQKAYYVNLKTGRVQ